MFLKQIECNIIRNKTQKNFFEKQAVFLFDTKYSLGFSLFETLISLFLLSSTSLFVMHLQLRSLHQIKSIAFYQMSHVAQMSLAERLRSCSGNQECCQYEISKWQQNIKKDFPLFTTEITSSRYQYRVFIHRAQSDQNLVLEFTL